MKVKMLINVIPNDSKTASFARREKIETEFRIRLQSQ